MTGKQSAVMWLGFLLIIARLFTTDMWSELWGTIGGKRTASTGPSGEEGSGGAITISTTTGQYGTTPV
jgi:hypothetical protein